MPESRPSRPTLDELSDDGRFASRHLGPREADRAAMLATLGYDDVDQLLDAVVPASIRLGRLAINASASRSFAHHSARQIDSAASSLTFSSPYFVFTYRTARRFHWSRGMPSGWPLARSAANSTPEPAARQNVRNVNGATSEIATFIAVQLKPQTSVMPISTHHRLLGRCSACPLLNAAPAPAATSGRGTPWN